MKYMKICDMCAGKGTTGDDICPECGGAGKDIVTLKNKKRDLSLRRAMRKQAKSTE